MFSRLFHTIVFRRVTQSDVFPCVSALTTSISCTFQYKFTSAVANLPARQNRAVHRA